MSVGIITTNAQSQRRGNAGGWPGQDRPVCYPAEQPATLPTLSSVIDSTVAAQILPSAFTGSLAYHIRFGPDGSLARLRALKTSGLPPDSVLAVSRRIGALVIQQDVSKGAWAIRLTIPRDTVARWSITRSEYCPPVPIDDGFLYPGERRLLSWTEFMEVVRGGSLEVRWDVNASGDATSVELSRSSGSSIVDEMVLTNVRRQRFRPATLDGDPVGAVVIYPRRRPQR